MGIYNKAIITDAGNALLTRAIAGEASIRFTKSKTSDFSYPTGTDFSKLTDLSGIKQTSENIRTQVPSDTLISVRTLFGNEAVSTSYYVRNIGLYATDGENEVLFSVSQAVKPDEMPEYDGMAPSSLIYNIQLAVSQALSVSITINPAGTATVQDIIDLESSKISNSQIVNNGMTNLPGFVLDARYGKTLTDGITQLYSEQDSTLDDVDLDDIRVFSGYCNGATNRPESVNGYLESVRSGFSNYILQRYTTYITNNIYVRQKIENGTWTSWKLLHG